MPKDWEKQLQEVKQKNRNYCLHNAVPSDKTQQITKTMILSHHALLILTEKLSSTYTALTVIRLH